MRYRLRTLLVALAVVPPVASLFWWLVARTELLPAAPAIPLGFTFAALTGIAVVWLTEFLDYVGLVASGKRRMEIHRHIPRYRLRTLVILSCIGPVAIAVVWWFATDTAFADEILLLAAQVWGWVLLSVPFVVLAYAAACFAAAVTKR
jgi:hypothetical protein